MTPTIEDRIVCWKRAYDALVAELAFPDSIEPAVRDAVTYDPLTATEIVRWRMETAARVAATLAIGAVPDREGR